MQPVPLRNQVGITVTSLYKDQFEAVTIETWDANCEFESYVESGAEVLVLDGSFSENGETLNKHSWLRVPAGSTIKAKTGDQAAKVWVKRGHLVRAAEEATRLPSL